MPLGPGSSFDLRFPAAAATGPRRVMVVDDDPDAVEMLRVLLEMAGLEVGIAYDGQGALVAAKDAAAAFDAALIDIGLPGIDGHEVARRLRAEPSCRGAFLVAVTGYDSDEDRARSREAGFDAHLAKPVEFDALLALLARHAFR